MALCARPGGRCWIQVRDSLLDGSKEVLGSVVFEHLGASLVTSEHSAKAGTNMAG